MLISLFVFSPHNSYFYPYSTEIHSTLDFNFLKAIFSGIIMLPVASRVNRRKSMSPKCNEFTFNNLMIINRQIRQFVSLLVTASQNMLDLNRF
jgi:hypothetical protein